jgi:hypothetical protein
MGMEYTDFQLFWCYIYIYIYVCVCVCVYIYIYEFLGALYLADVQFVDADWSTGVIFINLFKELCVCCISADTKHSVSLTLKCLRE